MKQISKSYHDTREEIYDENIYEGYEDEEAEIPYEDVTAELNFHNDLKLMNKSGYKLVTSFTSGKRGFFSNDFTITVVYEEYE